MLPGHDAIFVHFGYTIMASDYISNFGIDNINGLVLDGTAFWRSRRLTAPHNSMISMKNIRQRIEIEGYRNTSDVRPFNYSPEEIFLQSGNIANSINIIYSQVHTTSYQYDPEYKVYRRYMRGIPHVDYATGKQYTAKNIIIKFVYNSNLNDPREIPNPGYQRLETIGQGRGFFITNGEYIEITWKKESRNARTQYFDIEGNEIILNDGITYIQVVPVDTEVVMI